MRVLVVNAGSSSLKMRLLGPDDGVEAVFDVDPWDGSPQAVAAGGASPDAVGHRVVHGGSELREATVVDDGVIARIEALSPLAPLHQPRAVAAMRAVAAALPDVPSVACFDTGFHATLPEAAATYAVPAAWVKRFGIRRFGFHGLSHQYAARRAAEMVGGPVRRMVTCHLGAGASLCAVLDGHSVDTTMGFTPLEGLVMATRSGTVDPGLVLWLLTDAQLGAREVTEALDRRSGLAGLSGTSGDLREVLAAADAGQEAATLALDVYLHRLRRELGAMVASLGGLDVLVFTGGVGEHAPAVRARAARGLAFLGVDVDQARNRSAIGDCEITAEQAAVRTLVVTAREEVEIARQVRRVLAPRP